MKYLSGAVMMQVTPSIVPGTIQVDLGSSVNVTTTLRTPPLGQHGRFHCIVQQCAVHHSQEVPGSCNHRATPGGYTPSSARDQQEPCSWLLSTSFPRQDQNSLGKTQTSLACHPAGRGTGLTWR